MQLTYHAMWSNFIGNEMQLTKCGKWMQGIENLPFCRSQGDSSLGGGVSSWSTSEALLGSGDDEFEDGSFFYAISFYSSSS